MHCDYSRVIFYSGGFNPSRFKVRHPELVEGSGQRPSFYIIAFRLMSFISFMSSCSACRLYCSE
jgi:hypothetical protein